MSASSQSRHGNYYKNKGQTNENLRKKRQENSVQLRKGKREEQVLKRRNINLEDLNTSPLKEMNYQDNSGSVMSFDEIIRGIMDDTDPEKQYQCTLNARKILSRERHPPINKMVEANIVHKLVDFLGWNHNTTMQFEAAWALTNIASGNSDQTVAVVNAGAVPKLIGLLSCGNKTIVEQAMWALGNIAGDGAQLRDLVLDKGIVKPLVSLFTPDAEGSFVQNLTWTISNLCRNKNPHTALPYVAQLLPTIVKLLYLDDLQVKTDVCWALSYVTDGPNDRIEMVLNVGVLPEIVRLLDNISESTLLTPVLRVIGNIVTGNDNQTQRVIDVGVLPTFRKLLTNNRNAIQKEAAWTLSNITAGTKSQIQSVIDAGLIPMLVNLLRTGDYKAQREACWAVTNYTSSASLEQMVYLVQCNAVEALCGLLRVNEPKILQVCMDGLTTILNAATKLEKVDDICIAIEACGGLDAIENLQQHDNAAVYEMALGIIDQFFVGDDEEDAPATNQEGDYFAFSQPLDAPAGGFRL